MDSPKIISETPDKPNIYLQRIVKPPNIDIIECAESVYAPELKKLLQLRSSYPVTLCYMPLEWCSDAQSLAVELFGEPCITDTLYAIVFSTQDNSITSHVMKELKKKKPSLRLVFCSSSLGMGFDSPCITRIIHGKPPRTMIDFVQQLGRAGRSGQSSESVMYYNSSDIAARVGARHFQNGVLGPINFWKMGSRLENWSPKNLMIFFFFIFSLTSHLNSLSQSSRNLRVFFIETPWWCRRCFRSSSSR